MDLPSLGRDLTWSTTSGAFCHALLFRLKLSESSPFLYTQSTTKLGSANILPALVGRDFGCMLWPSLFCCMLCGRDIGRKNSIWANSCLSRGATHRPPAGKAWTSDTCLTCQPPGEKVPKARLSPERAPMLRKGRKSPAHNICVYLEPPIGKAHFETLRDAIRVASAVLTAATCRPPFFLLQNLLRYPAAFALALSSRPKRNISPAVLDGLEAVHRICETLTSQMLFRPSPIQMPPQEPDRGRQ